MWFTYRKWWRGSVRDGLAREWTLGIQSETTGKATKLVLCVKDWSTVMSNSVIMLLFLMLISSLSLTFFAVQSLSSSTTLNSLSSRPVGFLVINIHLIILMWYIYIYIKYVLINFLNLQCVFFQLILQSVCWQGCKRCLLIIISLWSRKLDPLHSPSSASMVTDHSFKFQINWWRFSTLYNTEC